MNKLEDDPIIGRFFNTPEKKARWIIRIKFALILWIIFMIIGLSFMIWSILK